MKTTVRKLLRGRAEFARNAKQQQLEHGAFSRIRYDRRDDLHVYVRQSTSSVHNTFIEKLLFPPPLLLFAKQEPPERPSRQARRTWSWPREAVIPPTCQVVLSLHPSDGGGRLAADGYAGELRLVPLADHVLSALDDWAAWRDWPHSSTNVQTDACTHICFLLFCFLVRQETINRISRSESIVEIIVN